MVIIELFTHKLHKFTNYLFSISVLKLFPNESLLYKNVTQFEVIN